MNSRNGKRRMSSAKPRDSRPTIGLLSEVGGSSYYNALWAGFASAAPELDVNLICYVGGTINASEYGFDEQRNILHDLITAERVDGLIICGTIGNFITTEEFRSFIDRYRPLLMVGITQTPGLPSIIVDNEKGMRDVVTHFIEVHGYRRIAFICGPENNEEAALRYRAYVDALAEHDLPLDPDLIAPGAFIYETGIDAIRLLLDERKVKFDAVVAANDWMAFGVLKALEDRGIRVPDDVALGGFDDTREAAASRPSLTTVRQPIHKLGQAGIEVLLKLLAGEQVPEQTMLPTELMVRQSCGCSEPVVVHAAVGPLKRKREPLQEAIVSRREEILSEMVQVVRGSASSSSEWAGWLLDAFLEEMTSGSAASKPDVGQAPQGPFLSALDDVLQQTVTARGQVDDWQEAISVMRRHILPYVTNVATLSRVEDLFSQGRVAVGRMAQWNWARQEVEEIRRAEALSYLSGDLVAAVETEQIVDVVGHRLPQLGFSTFYLSFYDGQERPAEWSRLMLAYDRGGRVEVGANGRRFPTRQLVPDELFPQERRYTWVVESLNFRENHFGCIILETGSREGDIYGTLARQISGALQDSLLVQQLENRRLQLMTAAEVSRAASSILELDELIQQMVDLVRKRFDLYYAGLFLVDQTGEWTGEPGKWAVLRAGTGQAGQKMLKRGHMLEIGGKSMIGWCVANKQARIALDVGQEAVRFDNPLLPETRSEMALPLVARGQVIGAMTIQSAQAAAFSEEDIAVLQTMADQLANAIANARLFEALAREQYMMRALMDNVPDYIYFKDRESRFIRTTKAHAKTFGLSDPAEAIGKTDFDFFSDEHAQQAYEDEQRIVRTGEPMLNVEERETWPDRPDTWVLTSKMPLRDGAGNIVGTFGVSSDITPRKRAEEALERRAVQLQTAAKVSYAASSVLDPEELIQQVVNLVRERFDLYYAGLFLVDQTGEWTGQPGKWAVLRAGTGEAGQKMVEQGHKLEIGGTSMIGWCVANKQARIALDVGQEAVRFDNPLLPETRSELALPLVSRGQVIGAMTVQSAQAAAFSEEDIAVLQTMADQLAIAIANARLFEDTKSRLAQLTALRETTGAVASTLELDKLLNLIVQQATTLFQGTGGIINLVDWEKKEDEVVVASGSVASALGFRNPLEGSLGGWVALHNQPVISNQLQNDERVDPRMRSGEVPVQSAAIAPLTIKDQVIGTLVVMDKQGGKGEFNQADLDLLVAFANQAATAIENARLFERTQHTSFLLGERVRELHCLNDIGRKMDETPPIPEFLPWVAARIRAAMQYPDLCLAAIQFEGQVYGATEAVSLPCQMVQALRIGGEVVGRVYISYTEERDFTDEESALLGDIVRRISGYIESRHLFEQTQAALAEMEATQRRYLQWAWTEYPQTAKTTSYETERPGAAPLGDAVLPEVQQAVERQSATVLTGPSTLRQAQDVASSGHGDGAKGPALSKAEGESHSALVAPIALRGQVIGALGIHDEDGARQWTDAEIALVEAVAERMALTAENLRLFEETQRRAARERLTREITDKMRRAADMDALMRIAAQELAQALGISHAAVELGTDLQES